MEAIDTDARAATLYHRALSCTLPSRPTPHASRLALAVVCRSVCLLAKTLPSHGCTRVERPLLSHTRPLDPRSRPVAQPAPRNTALTEFLHTTFRQLPIFWPLHLFIAVAPSHVPELDSHFRHPQSPNIWVHRPLTPLRQIISRNLPELSLADGTDSTILPALVASGASQADTFLKYHAARTICLHELPSAHRLPYYRPRSAIHRCVQPGRTTRWLHISHSSTLQGGPRNRRRTPSARPPPDCLSEPSPQPQPSPPRCPPTPSQSCRRRGPREMSRHSRAEGPSVNECLCSSPR